VSPRRATVLGLGNVLLGDDGVGPFTALLLAARWRLDPEVSVVDLGTPGLDLAPYLEGLDLAIVLDAIRADGPPGTVRVYTKSALERRPPGIRTSPHDPGLHEALGTLALAGRSPRELLLVGVVPESMATGIGLTSAVRAAASEAADRAAAELRRHGFGARRRALPRALDAWWERGGARGP
jgi:hydrogenase maturation protease